MGVVKRLGLSRMFLTPLRATDDAHSVIHALSWPGDARRHSTLEVGNNLWGRIAVQDWMRPGRYVRIVDCGVGVANIYNAYEAIDV